MITKEQLIKYLRLSVKVSDTDGTVVTDTAYLSMTDEDLILYLNISLSRDFPNIDGIEFITNQELFSVILLTKKELFYTLAIQEAPLFDLGADNNNYLKRDQRFQHYMDLIEQLNAEYNTYIENGGGAGTLNTLTSYNITLPNWAGTKYNYDNGIAPLVKIRVNNVTSNYVEISWESFISRFYELKIFCSKSNILDLYSSTKISSEAQEVLRITDSRQNSCRLENLEPNTIYYVAIQIKDLSSLIGYNQVEFITLL